jgi:hypothetical protein
MSQTLYLLTATCLLQGDPAALPQPAVTPTFHGVATTLPPLPMPTAAPLCQRLNATTHVFLQPIPMPLDILSDPAPGFCQRVRMWKSMHRKSPGGHPAY